MYHHKADMNVQQLHAHYSFYSVQNLNCIATIRLSTGLSLHRKLPAKCTETHEQSTTAKLIPPHDVREHVYEYTVPVYAPVRVH